MLDRDRVIESFKTALAELEDSSSSSPPSFTKIAGRAHELFCQSLEMGGKKPSVGIFRSYLFGKRAKPWIMELVTAARIGKVARLERDPLLHAFRAALESGRRRYGKKLRPRTVGVLAHRIYCELLPPGGRLPALISFIRRVTGKTADPEILDLLRETGVASKLHAQLNREKLKEAFGECIRKLEWRILKGIAKPAHVADSAHKIYIESMGSSEIKPSRLTFRRMIYGQAADPEIVSLLDPHFPPKK